MQVINRASHRLFLVSSLILCTALVLVNAGCGGATAVNAGVNPPAGSVSVSVSPNSISLQPGSTQQFTATVSGSTNASVTWSATAGTISSTGLYTAPAAAGVYNITATSVADSSKSASAVVTVASAVGIAVNPSAVSLQTGATEQFAASVTGSSNTAVTWSANGGSVSSSGLYTAPSTTGTYTVTATSAADSTKSDSATVTVTAPVSGSVAINPNSVSLKTGATQQFTATVTGLSSTAVTWSATGGSVSASGLYTAPAGAGTYTVKATSVADTTKSASATVTVTAPVAVSVNPGSVSLSTGGTQQFSATVTGSSNTSVTWSATGGTISSSGLYTAPGSAGSYTVRATSAADTTKSATASVTVVTPVSVSVSPTSATVASGATKQFTATVTGSSNTSVTWTATAGTVSSSGLFTAPTVTSNTSVTVKATSAADSTKFASATVTVTPPPVSVSINPVAATIAPSATQQFTATVSGSSNTSVTWSATGGTVSSSGLYTAPGTTGTYTVKATSAADSTKSASATVNVATGGGTANGWANRTSGVNLPGGSASIVSSYSFDNTISLPHCTSTPCSTYSQGAQSYFTYYYDSPNSFSTDCTTAADGCAMKIVIAPGYNWGDPGYFDYNFSPNLSTTFGPGQEFYIQYRERVSANMITAVSGGEGFKSDITTEGDTATAHAGDCSNSPAEFVTQQNGGGSAYPIVYFNCGSSGGQYAFMQSGYQTMQVGGIVNSNYLDQDATGCPHYTGSGTPTTDPTCWNYVGDEWFTIQKHVKIGQWGQPNSVVELWAAHQGQPARLVAQASDAALVNDGSGGASGKYGKIQFSVYNTNGTWQINSAAWFDDVIVSTRRIPDPNVSTPNAPDSLGISNITNASVQVNWRVNSQNGTAQDDTGFVVERCSGTIQTCFPNPQGGFSAIATTAAGASSYVDNTVVHGTTYTYRVKATNANGSSGYATSICFNNSTVTCGGTAQP